MCKNFSPSSENPIIKDRKNSLHTNTGPLKTQSLSLDLEGKVFSLKFSKFNGDGPEPRKTVVFLCGGPSNCSESRWSGIPSNYDIITFDPIGIGRNYDSALSPQMESISNQAKFTAAIVDKLQLKDYVISGKSFGTAIATEAAALIESNSKSAHPKAVVLEGVFGPRASGVRDFVGVSQKIFNNLNESEQQKLQSILVHAQKDLGISKKDIIYNMFDLASEGPTRALAFLKNSFLKRGNDKLWKKYLQDKDSAKLLNSKENQKLYNSAGCEVINHKEINAGALYSKRLNIYEYKNVNVKETVLCKCRSTKNDYNPCNHKIKAPIIYLNGTDDPYTPVRGVDAHYNCQDKSLEKKKLLVTGYGHFLTTPGYPLDKCQNLIYESAFTQNLSKLDEHYDWSQGCSQEKNDATATPTIK